MSGTNDNIRHQIALGTLTNMMKRSRVLVTTGEEVTDVRSRSEVHTTDVDEMFCFCFDFMAESSSISNPLLLSKTERCIAKERYDFLRSHLTCNVNLLTAVMLTVMIKYVKLGHLIAVDDILWACSSAGNIGISIPSKPARFGVYGDLCCCSADGI